MSDIWSLLKTANDALKSYFLCVPPYRCVNGEYLNEINESISAGKDPSLKVRGSINLPWQRAYQFEYRYKKCKIFEPLMPAIEYATYDAMEGNWICAYLSFLAIVEAVLRKWADEQSLTFERMKGIAPALVKHMQSQKYFPDERIAITDGYIDYFQYILCEVLYEGFDGYKLKSFSDIFNRNLSLHKLEGVMDISEGLSNVTRIMLVLDIIAELYFMQNPEEYWTTTFHADPENNPDFQLRWKLYTKHSVLAIGPNDRLIIQNALLNHVEDDIKKATTAKLDLKIKLLSSKFTTGDKENG